MNGEYYISPEIRMLVQRNGTGEHRLLEEKILNREMIPKIVVWNDFVIDDIDIFELCVENDIEFRPYSMDFPSVFHVYSWICSDQIERRDLTNTMRRFLLGFLAISESAIRRNTMSQSILDVPAKREAIDAIARCYSLSSVCIFNYKKLTESILRINEISPVMAECILNERMKITAQQILSLGNKSGSEILRFTDEVTKITDGKPKYAEMNKKLQLDKQLEFRKRRTGSQESVPEIRKMPKYDPDAELTSLTLTVPTWISSITRMCRSGIESSSAKARNDLLAELFQLTESAERLKQYLEDIENYEQ